MLKTCALQSRRTLLARAVSLTALTPLMVVPQLALASESVEIENFDAAGRSLGKSRVARIVRADAEWQRSLSSQSFEVTRHAGTEAAYTGAYWNLHKDGLFRCVVVSPHYSTREASSTPALAGRASRGRSRLPTLWRNRTPVWAWSALRCPADAAMLISAMCSTTGRRRPAHMCMNSAALVFVPRVRGQA